MASDQNTRELKNDEGEILYTEKEVTLQDAIDHVLNEEEFEAIQKFLGGRLPTSTELGLYSALWSEHCSYKNSILQLKTLPVESVRALTKAGEENAGALDIGDGLAVVFKIESHNHPSAIEPYQGAATGVGGIMRDIFTMGARPICSLNSLRFGPPTEPRNRYLLARAVKGIGDYGNCLGIAVSGGELYFDDSFTRNCLVNAMTVGIVEQGKMASAEASGVGNPIFLVGATTGRDGIHGASFASRDLSAESESKRSAVQVGDPFMEKLLLEATLELIASDAIIGIQDMGAAGISCSSAEMSAKGGVGMKLDLDKVPLRETGMNAYEIMLSESQERMLVCVKKGREEEVNGIFKKWDLNSVQIGTVISEDRLLIYREGKLCVDVPASSLVLGGGAPRYVREQKRPAYLDEVRSHDFSIHPDAMAVPESAVRTMLRLLASENLCSRRPLYEQYDTEVGLVRVIGPGGDGGLAHVAGTKKGIAVSADCNSRYVYLDPYQGTAQAVFESARNVAVIGAEPIGITNCLNFGNPYVPENYYVFAQCIAGMAKACRKLNVPVTGGNVSFYNESEDGPVQPTPAIGMVGLLEDVSYAVKPFFDEAGRSIYLVGTFRPSFGGSEYMKVLHGLQIGVPPELDFDRETKLINYLQEGAKLKLHTSARDLSIGGLAMTLFRSCRFSPDDSSRSVTFKLDGEGLKGIGEKKGSAKHPAKDCGGREDLLFFGETNGCALVSCANQRDTELEELARSMQLEVFRLGETTVSGMLDYAQFRVNAAEACVAFEEGLSSVF